MKSKYSIGDRVKTRYDAQVTKEIMIPAGTMGKVIRVDNVDHKWGKVYPCTRRGYTASWVEFDSIPMYFLMYNSQLEWLSSSPTDDSYTTEVIDGHTVLKFPDGTELWHKGETLYNGLEALPPN
jgi:hypothetical protein